MAILNGSLPFAAAIGECAHGADDELKVTVHVSWHPEQVACHIAPLPPTVARAARGYPLHPTLRGIPLLLLRGVGPSIATCRIPVLVQRSRAIRLANGLGERCGAFCDELLLHGPCNKIDCAAERLH